MAARERTGVIAAASDPHSSRSNTVGSLQAEFDVGEVNAIFRPFGSFKSSMPRSGATTIAV
jgi:hypothetical protein